VSAPCVASSGSTEDQDHPFLFDVTVMTGEPLVVCPGRRIKYKIALDDGETKCKQQKARAHRIDLPLCRRALARRRLQVKPV